MAHDRLKLRIRNLNHRIHRLENELQEASYPFYRLALENQIHNARLFLKDLNAELDRLEGAVKDE